MADAVEDGGSALTPAQRKLFELRMKVNAGRKANKQEVAAEHERVVNKDAQARKAAAVKRKQEWKEEAASGTTHLKETGAKAFVYVWRKEKRKAAFGWDVFNQDSLFKGYKKRLVNLPTHAGGVDGSAEASALAVPAAAAATADLNDLEHKLSYGKSVKVPEENLDRMAQELEERIQARKKFSRRRQHYEGEDVDYINDQNRLFNRKAKQAFDKYTVEIRQNLERGTAL
ncbi:hypothetical protein PybrP1_006202 [[Pythium] brassicae (nom. inval.)]|nr:hypothetical protein PybrP1_006202 [[Pythium] brassicae (nom. inval.)]